MRVTRAQVACYFDDLIAEQITREAAADWASTLTKSDDDVPLEYDPSSASEQITDALEFLMGVDLKDSPNSYLHTSEDIESFWAGMSEVLY